MEHKKLLEVGDIVYLPHSFSSKRYTKYTVIRVTNTQAILNDTGLKTKRELNGIYPDLYAQRIGGGDYSPSTFWLESERLKELINFQNLKDTAHKLLDDTMSSYNSFSPEQLTSLCNYLLTLKPKEQTT